MLPALDQWTKIVYFFASIIMISLVMGASGLAMFRVGDVVKNRRYYQRNGHDIKSRPRVPLDELIGGRAEADEDRAIG